MGLDRGKRSLKPYFSRPLNDWDVDNAKDLFLRLQGELGDSVG